MSILPDWTADVDPEVVTIAVGVGNDLEIDATENDYAIAVEAGADITTATACNITPEHSDLEVEVLKKEYSVVGDSFYASISADDAPQWLVSIIDSVVDTAVTSGLVNYDDLVQDVRSAIEALDVAANTYVEQINFTQDVDGIIGTHLTTLNTTLENTYATIVDLDTAVANTDLALTQSVNDLTAAYTDEINSQITTIQTAYSDADTAIASDIDALTSSFIDQEGNLVSLASAVTGLQTYVGVDAAGASTFTNLSAYMETPEGVIGGATSNVTNGVYVNGEGNPESQFEYTSTLHKNGVYHTAGFGLELTTASGSGTELDPYSSEFWIDAEKFKFTNSAQTGTAAPFTIDASGATPQITFNGVVSFTNVSDTPTHTDGLLAARPISPVVGSTYTATDEDNQLYTFTSVGWIAGGDPDALTAYDIGVSGTTVIDGGRVSSGIISGITITGNNIYGGTINVPQTSPLFSVASDGTVNIKSGSTGQRLEVTNNVIRVYDASNVLRVKLGDLS